MKYQKDDKLKTHMLWFDGPLDLLSTTVDRVAELGREGKVPACMQRFVNPRTNWPQRTGTGWPALKEFVSRPWPHAMDMISKVVTRVQGANLPDPKDTRRKARWSDDSGEVDAWRAMGGEAEYMRRTVRARVNAPPHVTLLCNLDLTCDSICNPSGVWFRSAAAMAVADRLEGLGYGVDIVTWCLGGHVYPRPYHWQLVACRPKRAGDPVDFNTLCDTMSEWFTTKATWGAFLCCPTLPESLGAAFQPDEYETDPWKTPMSPWLRLMDLEVGTIPVLVPMARGYWEDAVRCAERVLARVIEQTG